MIVLNGINKLGLHLYIGTSGQVMVGDCEDADGNFSYRIIDGVSAHLLDDSKGGCNVLISKKEYDKLKRRNR